jgi:predicted transcriptional regulator
VLYSILADVLELHEQIEASQQRDKLIKLMRERLKSIHNIKTQANTKTTALVTKYVTRASRKTAHVYSRVLEVAIANGIDSTGLVAFIQSKGGIDKVRMAVASAEAVTQQNALIKHYQQQLRGQLTHKPAIGNLDLSSISHTLPTACDVDFQHLLCRYNHVTKAHEIVGIMYPSSALETQAMSEYLTMLDVACHSNQSSFYERCKQHGLNMDILLRWMGANGIKDAGAAKAVARSLTPSANPATNTPVALLKAA